LNYELYLDINDISEEDWGQFVQATFVLLKEKESKQRVEGQVQKYLSSLNDSREDWEADSFYLVNLNDMGNHARYVRNSFLGNNNPEGAIMIPNIMAIVILLVACFNFMNTSIALSGNRLKEIGVRKAIGARRSQLIMQLLTENILIILLALGGGILLAEVLLPLYTQLGPWLDLKINYSGNITFFSFLIGLLLLTAVLSGAYPAFYVSRFNTSNIFSGRFRLKGTGALSKGLMVLQLGFSLIALIQGIVYVENTYLQNGFDLGYKKNGVITIPYKEGVNFDSYRNKVLTHTSIEKVGGARHHMGYNVTGGIASIDAIKNEIRVFEVGDNYLETMEFDVVLGRSFLKDSESEMDNAIIVNEYFLKDYELQDPLDQRVILDDHPYHIVGIVKDFYPFGLWKSENDLASIIKLVDKDKFGFIVANVNSDVEAADKYLEQEWKAMFQDVPYESEKENIHVHRSELLSGNMAVLNIFLALTALFLSATGLFTLISINIQKRTKEIGLRRIMGASISQIVSLINKGFIIVVLISVVFGSVLGTYLTEMFLDIMYSIHSHVGFLAIGLTTGLVVLIVTLTSGFKVIKAADSPPVEALKYE
jgi:ABC-type antimicrobial peptide transport system permease subunit